MAKKEKLVDLKPEKVTDEQLNKIQTIVSNINKAQMEIGRYEAGKHTLLHTVQSLQGELKVIQTELEEQYGTVNINIEDGTIKYPENEQADKKN
jgi:hypothetical protein|tara:strand:+ start:127 stop:408 length:282 start_codon:yes stop_codon:yes gene_type:complete